MAYDLANVNFRQSLDVSAQVTTPAGVAFNADGSKLYVADFGNSQIDSYLLGTNWDISTATHNNTMSATEPRSVLFNDDGTKIYTLELLNLQVKSWTLSTAYDISNVTAANTLSVNPQTNDPTGMAWNDDGTKLFVVEDTDDEVEEYTLTAGYDISTASHDSSHSVSAQDTTPEEVDFNADGTKMFLTGDQNDTVFEYDLLNQYDPGSGSVVETLDVSPQDTTPLGGKWGDSGAKLYVAGGQNDNIYQYGPVRSVAQIVDITVARNVERD